MGCSTSKLDDDEAVQLCKDRKNFIQQAVEQRTRFASGHAAYIQSLKRVSAALREYVEGDEPREFSLDSYITPPFTPVKKSSPDFISISPNSFSAKPIKSKSKTTLRVNYLRPGGTQAVSVEERPQSPETVRVETYSPPIHHYGVDNIFAMQSPPVNSYTFFSYPPDDRPNIPPASPQASQWDFFWNPFSSLDYYGYPTRSSLEQTSIDDDIRGLRQVREEEGIPDLEEDDTEQEEPINRANFADQRGNTNCCREEVVVEDVDSDDDDNDDDDEDDEEDDLADETETEQGAKGLQTQGSASIEVSRAQNSRQVEVANQKGVVSDKKPKEETPGFTAYANRRPTSMAEVIKDLEDQFTVVCNAAKEVSAMLETSRAQYTSTSADISAMKMLNPVALIRSASSRSASSRFLVNSSSSKDESCESTNDFSEESMFSGSHQSTLDKLYAWEKKLYQEVKTGEKKRIAYEKKCKQLRNQDVKGADPSLVDKTRATIRDLHTQISVSIHTVEAISKRIETLRDEELQPQLIELAQGLSRMWKVMAECHQLQKRTLDEAKLLLAGTPTKQKSRRHSGVSLIEPQQLARSAANLETELRNWRACFESWITSQRSYVHALAGWLLRCVRCDPDTSRVPLSPRRSSGTLPIFGLCIQWSRSLDDIREMPVLDGMDFFAAGVGSLYAQQLKEDSRTGSKRFGSGISSENGNMEMVEFGQIEEEAMSAEKMAEVAIRVLCAGMSVAVSSLAEFAIGSAKGYDGLVKQWEKAKWPQRPSQA